MGFIQMLPALDFLNLVWRFRAEQSIRSWIVLGGDYSLPSPTWLKTRGWGQYSPEDIHSDLCTELWIKPFEFTNYYLACQEKIYFYSVANLGPVISSGRAIHFRQMNPSWCSVANAQSLISTNRNSTTQTSRTGCYRALLSWVPVQRINKTHNYYLSPTLELYWSYKLLQNIKRWSTLSKSSLIVRSIFIIIPY